MKDINEMTLEELQALAEAVSAKIAELTGEEKPEVTEAARSLMDGLTNNTDELNKLFHSYFADDGRRERIVLPRQNRCSPRRIPDKFFD